MSREELTESEQELLDAMKADDGAEPEPDTAATKEDEGAAAEPVEQAVEAAAEPDKEPDAEEPEFKSSRADGKPPEGFVPHQAMHAERARRQEVERRLEQLEAKLAPKDEETAPEWADPVVDPDAYRKWQDHQNALVEKRLEAIEANHQEQARAAERRARAQSYEQDFIENHQSDYLQASVHLQQSRMTELVGQGLSEGEALAQIRKDANAIFDAAEAAGLNPAQLIYQSALQAGYKAKQEQPEQTDQGAKIVALAEAQKKTQGLGSAGGGEQRGKITPAQLGEMSEAEMAKLDPATIRQIMGG